MRKHRILAAALALLLLVSGLVPHALAAEDEMAAYQYGYDETPQQRVRVYATVSNNGVPLLGLDTASTPLTRLAVDVPYFDLGPYGLGNYARYHTDGGQGGFVSDIVVERPTVLHLYLYLLVRYAVGAEVTEEDFVTGRAAKYLKGKLEDPWFEDLRGNTMEFDGSILEVEGGSTSMYMRQFWGHDENLMYYRNHVYPLMSAGIGSTANYILLSDGDTVDVGLFDNWEFYHKGAFCCFAEPDETLPADSYTVLAGDTLTVQTMKFGTQESVDGGVDLFVPTDELRVSVYDENWGLLSLKAAALGGGQYAVRFPSAGTYYLLAEDQNSGEAGSDSPACYAPGVATVNVVQEPPAPVVTRTPAGVRVEVYLTKTSGYLLAATYQSGRFTGFVRLHVPNAGRTALRLRDRDCSQIRLFCLDRNYLPGQDSIKLNVQGGES